MGYQTDFELTMTADFDIIERYPQLEYVEAVMTKYTGYSAWEGEVDYLRLDSAKWYDYKKDMSKMSADFPDILFSIEGRGEEQDDVWRGYWKGGKSLVVSPEIVWPEFDESMLS